jgi:hypothetical protein
MNIRIITATAAPLSNFGLAQHAHAIDPAAVAAIAEAIPQIINPAELKWEKTIPSAGATSPEYAILHVDPKAHPTMLMFRTPVPVHIKAHTHKLAETHAVLAGATHVNEQRRSTSSPPSSSPTRSARCTCRGTSFSPR